MFYARLEPFRIVNGYGLFRVMTKDRKEIVIEGSADGIDWQPYEFKWKPGDVMRPPGWCQPHQPRLDWQMWFAALGSYRQESVVRQTGDRLLHGKPQVDGALRTESVSRNAAAFCSRDILSLPIHDRGGTSTNRRVVETRRRSANICRAFRSKTCSN